LPAYHANQLAPCQPRLWPLAAEIKPGWRPRHSITPHVSPAKLEKSCEGGTSRPCRWGAVGRLHPTTQAPRRISTPSTRATVGSGQASSGGCVNKIHGNPGCVETPGWAQCQRPKPTLRCRRDAMAQTHSCAERTAAWHECWKPRTLGSERSAAKKPRQGRCARPRSRRSGEQHPCVAWGVVATASGKPRTNAVGII